MGSKVGIRGLKEFDRALGRADKELRRDLRRRLKDIAEIVAVGARAKAAPMRKSGDLIAGIKPYALMGKAGVRSGALHGGYSYPSRLEYEGKRGDYGPHATLLPAYEEAKPVVMMRVEQLLDEFTDNATSGGVGVA